MQVQQSLCKLCHDNCFKIPHRFVLLEVWLLNWKCMVCGYVYEEEQGDPDSGVAPGTAFEDLPDDWVCPGCGVPKDQFEPLE